MDDILSLPLTKGQFEALHMLSWGLISWEKDGWAEGVFVDIPHGLCLSDMKILNRKGLCTWEAAHATLLEGRVMRRSTITFSLTKKGAGVLRKRYPMTSLRLYRMGL
jgi:hypothetical protein